MSGQRAHEAPVGHRVVDPRSLEGAEVQVPDDLPGGSDVGDDARVAPLLKVVQRFAFLDFSEHAPVSGAGDELDALAAMINLLGEELEQWNADFKVRVERRTVQLTAASEQLETEVAERRRSEKRLAVVNVELADHVEHLRRLNNQISQLTEMSFLLQAAGDPDEAFDVVVRFAPTVFAGADGAIYVATSTRPGAQLVRSWGPRSVFSPVIETDGCTVLRQGGNQGQGEDDSHCRHLPPGGEAQTRCVALTAQGEVLGVLSLVWGNDLSAAAPGAPSSGYQPADLESQRVALAAAEQLALALANLALRRELRNQSIRDVLTGLYNRRYLDETLASELRHAACADLSVAVLMIDIDHFKEFNDAHGHPAGDRVLTELARVILDSVRTGDVACRFGGEEFAVILAGADQVAAATRAEHLRASIARHAFQRRAQPSTHVTVSIGAATRPQHGTSPDSLICSADAALYRAKDGGRNQVVTAS